MKEIGIYIALASFVCGLIAYAVRLTFQLTRVEKQLRADIDAEIDNVQRDVAKLERECIDRTEQSRHDFGETVAAIRQKVHDVETWNRDTFVRKESFEIVIGRIEKSLEKLGDRFEEKMDRILERIQSKQG